MNMAGRKVVVIGGKKSALACPGRSGRRPLPSPANQAAAADDAARARHYLL